MTEKGLFCEKYFVRKGIAMADKYDEYWDISKLVPKKNKPTVSQFSSKPKVVEIDIDGDAPKESAKLSFEQFKVAEDTVAESRVYVPGGNTLIKSVTIKPSIDRFDFYDTFRKAALIYFDYKCPKCDFVPFYSFKPQYSQMNAEQKKYYFFWRDELRHGRYIKTDYSYVYLYAYEILNLPEKISKDEGLRLLVDVWCAYRKSLPAIDTNFAAWVQDYCLVYELECPFDKIRDFIFDVITASSFKEFYLSETGKGSGCEAMLAYLSDYDWRQGKYAGGETRETYRMHLEGAMQRVITLLLSEGFSKTDSVTVINRSAFPGSLCTHSVKCNLVIEYYALSSSPELRANITSALKYTENKLRALLGIKSRLAVKELPERFKTVVDGYFAYEMAKLQRENAKKNAPEYEKLYDAPDADAELSFADAIEIERASWRMTERLVEGTEGDFDTEKEDFGPITENKVTAAAVAEDTSVATENDNKYGLSADAIKFLSLLAANDVAGANAAAKQCGVPASVLAEQINEAFADNFGDVILEDDGISGFVIIEDYLEDVIEWLK